MEAPSIRPTFSDGEVAQIAREQFGLVGTPQPLPSVRDQNVRIVKQDGTSVIVKSSAGDESRSVPMDHSTTFSNCAVKPFTFILNSVMEPFRSIVA